MQNFRHHSSWTSPTVPRSIETKCINWQSQRCSILQVNHQIRDEALPILFAKNIGSVCHIKHENMTKRPFSRCYGQEPCTRKRIDSKEPQSLVTIFREHEAIRADIINELYPSLFSCFATVRINFDWMLQGDARVAGPCLLNPKGIPLDYWDRQIPRRSSCLELMAMLKPLCKRLLTTSPDKRKWIVLLLS